MILAASAPCIPTNSPSTELPGLDDVLISVGV